MTWRARLGDRRWPWIAALVGILLASPALAVPASVDDHFHRAVLRPSGPVPDARSPLGMFAFIDDDTSRTQALQARGVFPWWLGERTRISFFRPLTELTHRLDYALWPDCRPAMHAHDLAWAFALLVAVGMLYRRVLGPTTLAGLAALVYAVDDAHGLPFGWTANRNAVLAAFFGVLAIHAHDRWRRGGERWAALASWAALALSLLSAEAGIGTMAYLVAHGLALDPGTRRERARSLAPAILIVIAWRGLSSALGYGVVGSALYVDPLRSPMRFAAVLALRAPVLLAGQWGPLPPDLDGVVGEDLRALEALACASFLVLLALALVPRLVRDPVMRFFAIGMVLAVIPISATFPSDRLLFFVGLGGSALVARAIEIALSSKARRGMRALGIGLAIVHLVLAPLALPARAYSPALVARYLDPCTHAPVEAAGHELVMIDALDACPAYLPLRAALDGGPAPASTFTIAPGAEGLHVTRLDARTLRIERDGGWFTSTHERAFWDPERPWHVGEQRPLGAGSVRIEAVTSDARPLAVSLRFNQPLEETGVVWTEIAPGGALVPFALPVAPAPSGALVSR